MLDYLYRLVAGFEREHGIHPNLLYINAHHIEHLTASFNQKYTLSQIMNMLEMELVIDNYTTHPHVCWSQLSQRKAS